MAGDLHFISGMPRSGSTLLSALLRQNRRLHAGMSSPVGLLMGTLMRAMSQEQATSVFIEDDQRRRILRGCAENYYADNRAAIVFDTNRAWCARMGLIADLWPKATVVALVRNPAWVLDSVERLIQRNALEPSGIFGYSADGTVYSRSDGLMAGDGMIGLATNALRQAVFGEHRHRLLLVRYESLTADPQGTLDAIYDRIGEPRFVHDTQAIEPDYEALMFDARMGTTGLHAVAPRVHITPRAPVLPPDLFERYKVGAFWEEAGGLPAGVQLV